MEKGMTDMPKVSICVPTYGNPEGMKRLLASVKEQTFLDYEVVVTDDSPDDSVKNAALNAGIKNLRYVKNLQRLGASANWNEAVRQSCGAYIKMMHHDDWFASPDSLARFVELLDRAPGAALAFSGSWQVALGAGSKMEEAGLAAQKGGAQEPEGPAQKEQKGGAQEPEGTAQKAQKSGVQESGSSAGPLFVSGERFARCISEEQERLIREDWRNLFLGNYIGAPSATIYRRSDQEYEPKLTWVMDMEYYMRLLKEQPEFAATKEPLVCIGVSNSQLTESCRTDGALNMFEYGYLFREFDLVREKRYRDRLIGVALKYEQPYSALEPYKIPREEYRTALRQKKKEDLLFLAGVAKRKILGK